MARSEQSSTIIMLTPYWEGKGGISSAVRLLAQNLRLQGFRVVVGSPDIAQSSEDLFVIPDYTLGAVAVVCNRCRLDSPAAIHVHGSRGLLAAAVVMSALVKYAPRVIYTHHTQPADVASDTRFRPLTALKNRLYETCISRVSSVTYVSDTLRKRLEIGAETTCLSKYVIPNGVEHRTLDPGVREVALARYHLSSAFPVIVMVGVMAWEWKIRGMIILMQAVGRLRDRFPSVRLLLVGDGPLRHVLEGEVRGMGLSSQVTITGYIDDPLPIMQCADIYAHIADNEACPIAVLEAMASQLPVLCSAERGTGELIDDGKTGLLAVTDVDSVERSLIRLCDSEQLRISLGRAAKEHAHTHHDWCSVAIRYAQLYGASCLNTGRIEPR